MKHFNVSKYNRSNPRYLDDWTSIWDALDEECKDVKRWSAYLDMERNYLDFSVAFLLKNKIQLFELDELQVNLDDETVGEFQKLKFGLLDIEWKVLSKAQQKIKLTELDKISLIQLALRGVIWLKFIDKSSGAYLSFDTDYYLLIGNTDANNIPNAADFSLYLREMNDPWE